MSVVTVTGDMAQASAEIATTMARYQSEHGSLSIERIHGEEASLEGIMSAVGSVSLFNPVKLVVIDGLSLNKEASGRIGQITAATSSGVEVMLLERKLDKRSKVYKDLKSLTVFKDFSALQGPALYSHLEVFTRSNGVEAKRPDVQYLVAVAGEDVTRLENEILKLIAYGSFSRSSIDLLVDKQLQSKVFDLLEAAMNKNSVQTLSLYAEQRMQKVEPQAILGLVGWQLHMLLLAKLSKDINATAKLAKVSAYPLGKAHRLVRTVPYEALKKLVAETARTDIAIKRGADADDAVRLLLLVLAK